MERRKKRREENEQKPRDQRRGQWTGEAGRRNSIDGERINNTELVRTLGEVIQGDRGEERREDRNVDRDQEDRETTEQRRVDWIVDRDQETIGVNRYM